ncbi:MAG: DUF2924 domain-containing protein [Phycisphaeraceae bacterium]|nr:DUF2924 domain-containing protein [Phycisphaeraceae bacterium]
MDDLEQLKRLPMPELRALWMDRIGIAPIPQVKFLLLRELAWHAQQQMRGGVDAQTRTLLRTAVKQVCVGDASVPEHALLPRRQTKVQLATGTRLVRTWGGVQHEVTVLEEGKRFEYRGETYRSLTRITRAITGAHWSGPRFFGLHRVKM